MKYIDLIKTGILLTEEIKCNTEETIQISTKLLSRKHDHFLEAEYGSILIDRYAVLVHIAQLTNLKFTWELVEVFYSKLKKTIPDEINELINKIDTTQK